MQRITPVRYIIVMRATHYLPAIPRPLLSALYHEAKQRHVPMTRLLAEILKDSLKESEGWQRALQDWPELKEAGKNDKVADSG